MSSLLGICQDAKHVYHEVDHILMLAAGHWQQRSGLHGTRHAEMQEKLVKIRVGMEDPILPCPEYQGGSGTPPGTPLRTRAGLTPRQKTKKDGNIRLAPLSPPSTARKASRRKLKTTDTSNVEEFNLSDYIVAESKTLLQMYEDKPDCQELTLRRSAKMFEMVVVLCKLRWLVRLHAAMMTFAGAQCSLQRMLLGMLADACNPDNLHLAAPVQVFELVVQTLHHRFQESWPLFIRYVSAVDVETYSKPTGCTHGHRPMSVPQNKQRIAYSRKDVAQSDRDSAASIWHIIDDIFVVWMVQADPGQVAVEGVMQELDYFGIPRPIVRTNLEFLYKWHNAIATTPSSIECQRKSSTLLAVQEQGHHLTAFLELPSMRSEAQYSKDVLIAMARSIVSHPLTFNVPVRKRLISALHGECRWVGFERIALSIEPDEDSMDFLSFTATRCDVGNIGPKDLQKWVDGAPRAATAWVNKREMLQPTWHHTPRCLPFKLKNL